MYVLCTLEVARFTAIDGLSIGDRRRENDNADRRCFFAIFNYREQQRPTKNRLFHYYDFIVFLLVNK